MKNKLHTIVMRKKAVKNVMNWVVINSFIPQYVCFYRLFSQHKFISIIMILHSAYLKWTEDYHSSYCTRVHPFCSLHNWQALMFFHSCSNSKWSLLTQQVNASTKSHVQRKPFQPHSVTSLTFECLDWWERISQSLFWIQGNLKTNMKLSTMLSFNKKKEDCIKRYLFA